MNTKSHRMPYKGLTIKIGVLTGVSRVVDFATHLQRFATGSGNLPCSSNLPHTLIAANEAPDASAIDGDLLASAPDQLTTAVNESADRLLVPFGDFAYAVELPDANGTARRVTVVQRFDQVAANEIVANYNSAVQKIIRSVTNGFGSADLPAFYRHPDQNDEHPDNRQYGSVGGLRVGADGLYGRVAYNEHGEALLADVKELKISPVWRMREIESTHRSASHVYRPFRLKSIGLTQFPNIPTAVAVNEKPKTPKPTMKPELLKALLALLSFSNERIDATIKGDPDAISITEATSAFAPFKTAANEAQKLPGLSTELDTAKELASTHETALTAANEENANLRQLVASNEVEAAVAAGKLKPSEREARIKAIVEADDFTTACNELQTIEPQSESKTQRRSDTKNLGARDSEELTAANEAQGKFNALIAARKAAGASHADAYAAVNASPEGQKLLATIRS
jgi:hypothetical protein